MLPTTSYRGTTDTEIDETEPSDVAGNDQVARIDGAVTIGFEDRFALVRWELTGIPSSARVRTVKMALFATDYPGSQSYQVRALKREWDEGHATWERATETQLWQRAGAKGGDDLADVEFTTLSPDQNGPFEVTFNAAGVAAVQRWVSDPATNFGLLLGQESNVDGMAIATSEAFEAANRPKLIIEIE